MSRMDVVMPAEPLFTPIALVAIDDSRNIRRRYEIHVSLDLFGVYVVDTRWGRIGGHTQKKRHSFADENGARRHVAATLSRRSSATRRIGTAYRRVAVSPLG
ncbi:WGR domain-containing protein [Sphingobium sp. BHU LFT2]|nr:WGR domain-containing protein [Sphingobium sp. BHU LFT2]